MSPISFRFVAAGVTTQAKAYLYSLTPAREGVEAPDWSKNDGVITTHSPAPPITDKSFWSDRYVLCELTLMNSAQERLVINDAVCSVSKSRSIVKTQIVGHNGTIKEYIDEGDFSIKITVGIVAVENGLIVDKYPEEGIRELKKFLEDKSTLRVQSSFLDIFDISSIVIESYSLTQETESNYQSLSITAISDDMDYGVFISEY